MKLEIKHLAPYLPHSLKCVYPEKYDEIFILVGLRNPYKTVNKWFLTTELRLDKSTKIRSHVFNTEKPEVNFKPILRPLSDLTKEIEHNSERFVPCEEIKKYYPLPSFAGWGFNLETDNSNVVGFRTPESWLPLVDWMPFYQKLFEWHFDVFDLIENGLAIDINSIENHS